MVYIFFDKRSSGTGIATLANQFAVNGNLNQNERPLVDAAMQQLAEELHWPTIRKFEKTKVYSSLKDKILGVDLADTKLISKLDQGIRFLLWVINGFSKYASGVSLKDKKWNNCC